MAEEFNEIMSRNMVTIILGEDITEEEVEINCRVSETSYSFVLKKLKLCQAIDECFQQLVGIVPTKMMNPLKQLDLISLRQNVTPFQR